jgi:hypothetical protein
MLSTRSHRTESSGLPSFTEAALMYCPLQENGTAPGEMFLLGQSLTGFLNVKNDSNACGLHEYSIKMVIEAENGIFNAPL